MSDTGTASMTMAFASPVFRFQIPNAETLNAMLEEESLAMREKSSGMKRSNRQGWHSDTDLMERTELGLSKLAKIIENSTHAASKAIAPEFDATEYTFSASGWININPQHGYNVPHRHIGAAWSGCYYVTVPKMEDGPSGSIEFVSPVIYPRELKVFNATCYKDNLTMRPKAGDLLLFPSYLMHWVYPNEVDEERITIAFNGSYYPKKPN